MNKHEEIISLAKKLNAYSVEFYMDGQIKVYFKYLSITSTDIDFVLESLKERLSNTVFYSTI